jgi:FtsP/CotA-like multicopper oxidase with cupredoxin domain
MAGAIVVEGDFADVPEIVQARERVMLLTEVVFDAYNMIEDFGTIFPEDSTRFLAINGQRRPTIDMRPGEVQRWRLVGSQYQDNMLLELNQHRLNVIAYDGIPLGAMQESKQLLMAPGQRADVLVQAGAPGTYELSAMPYDQGHASPTGPLARLVVAGEPLPMKLPAALPKPPLEPIRDSEIAGRRTLVFVRSSRRTTSPGTGRNTPSRRTARSSIPRASTNGCGWARSRNGRSATLSSTTTTCSTSTPTRSRSSRSAACRRPIGPGAIRLSYPGRPRAAAP